MESVTQVSHLYCGGLFVPDGCLFVPDGCLFVPDGCLFVPDGCLFVLCYKLRQFRSNCAIQLWKVVYAARNLLRRVSTRFSATASAGDDSLVCATLGSTYTRIVVQSEVCMHVYFFLHINYHALQIVTCRPTFFTFSLLSFSLRTLHAIVSPLC